MFIFIVYTYFGIFNKFDCVKYKLTLAPNFPIPRCFYLEDLKVWKYKTDSLNCLFLTNWFGLFYWKKISLNYGKTLSLKNNIFLFKNDNLSYKKNKNLPFENWTLPFENNNLPFKIKICVFHKIVCVFNKVVCVFNKVICVFNKIICVLKSIVCVFIQKICQFFVCVLWKICLLHPSQGLRVRINPIWVEKLLPNVHSRIILNCVFYVRPSDFCSLFKVKHVKDALIMI